MSTYAYVRVSTKEQNLDRQLIAMENYNIPRKNIFYDFQSGKDFDRPGYKKMIKRMRKGDILIIKSIDRLGRNYDEVLMQWQHITKKIQANIVVLDMPLLDTRDKETTVTGKLISDLVLQILAYVAQTERDFIRQRQIEGISAAKARGVKMGRKPVTLPESFDEICAECYNKKLTIRKAAETLGLSHSTFYRYYLKTTENAKL
ncbi:MAG: recombinase family protein [Oscillospiraceae bacterium]|nr:recombinase family protein [Oscillospiraceae bacterium]